MTVMYDPLTPAEVPTAFLTFPLCNMIRTIIMSVRRRLSERATTLYEKETSKNTGPSMDWWMYTMHTTPNAALIVFVECLPVGLHRVENIAAVKLVKKPLFNSYATEFEVALTKSPSISHWFKGGTG